MRSHLSLIAFRARFYFDLSDSEGYRERKAGKCHENSGQEGPNDSLQKSAFFTVEIGP